MEAFLLYFSYKLLSSRRYLFHQKLLQILKADSGIKVLLVVKFQWIFHPNSVVTPEIIHEDQSQTAMKVADGIWEMKHAFKLKGGFLNLFLMCTILILLKVGLVKWTPLLPLNPELSLFLLCGRICLPICKWVGVNSLGASHWSFTPREWTVS